MKRSTTEPSASAGVTDTVEGGKHFMNEFVKRVLDLDGTRHQLERAQKQLKLWRILYQDIQQELQESEVDSLLVDDMRTCSYCDVPFICDPEDSHWSEDAICWMGNHVCSHWCGRGECRSTNPHVTCCGCGRGACPSHVIYCRRCHQALCQWCGDGPTAYVHHCQRRK